MAFSEQWNAGPSVEEDQAAVQSGMKPEPFGENPSSSLPPLPFTASASLLVANRARCGSGARSCISLHFWSQWGFPGGSDGKESACNAENMSSIPESGRSPGEGNSNPLQYSCLGNPMDRRVRQATVHRVEKGQT